MANYNSTHTGAQIDAAVTKANALTHTAAQIDTAVDNATEVIANPTLAGTETALNGIKIAGTSYKNQPSSISYLTSAPNADNTDGIKIVVLSAEPGTYYNGYLYLIQGS